MQETMSSRERMIATLEQKPVDRVPLMQTEGGVWVAADNDMSIKELLDLPDLGVELIIKSFKEMKMDACNANSGCWLGTLSAAGCPVHMDAKGSPVEVASFITDPDVDVPKLDKSKIKENIANDELLQKLLKQAKMVSEKVGDEMLIHVAIVAPFSAANIMVGTEDFMVMMADEDDNIDALMDYAIEYMAEVANQFYENGVDMVTIADPNSSGDMISQNMYEETVEPTVHAYIEKVKGPGRYIGYHICGHTTARLKTVLNMDIDMYSFDAVVEVKDALDVLGGKITCLGNMDPAGLMLMGTAEDVYKACYENAELAGLKGGYIMCPGCDIPAHSPMENIHMMHKAACDYADAQK